MKFPGPINFLYSLPVLSALLFSVIAVITVSETLIASRAFAENKQVEKDLDGDGQVDQIGFYDEQGKICKVTTDTNKDLQMDRFQYYENEILIRLEQDKDYNRKIDHRDYFKDGKRIRQERLNSAGNLYQLTLFNEKEQPSLMKKDTSGSGYFDTLYHFIEGALTSSTRDPDENATINIWQTYTNNKAAELKADMDEDGKIEKIVLYDSDGLPGSSRHDLDGDGNMETLRSYKKGDIVSQQKDVNQDGKPDSITRFINALPVARKKDTNFDGAFDLFSTFKEGLVQKTEEDTQFSGRIDRIRYFEKGVPVKVANDSDGNGFFEALSYYKAGKLHLQTRDKNQDGTPDIRIFFNQREEKARTESDDDLNGVTETFEFFKNGRIVRLEKDENQNGRIDLKVFFRQGKKETLVKDNDENGCFEITQRFNDPKWTLVMEQDGDQDGQVDAWFYYMNGVVRQKEIDENRDSSIDLKEYYDRAGKLVKSQEKDSQTDRLNITWFFNEREQPIRSKKDATGDGNVDTWFFYDAGRLTRVEEDTNQDGKPDLWEKYDDSEVMLERKKDLDFDGTPDLVDYEKIATNF